MTSASPPTIAPWWWTASRSGRDLADVEAAAYDASVQRRAPVWFDPFQAVQLGQNLKKRGRQVCAVCPQLSAR